LGERRLWSDRRRIAEIDDLARKLRQIAGDGFGQCLSVGRALPFVLVHLLLIFVGARREAARNRYFLYLGGKSELRQRVPRMGASRGGTIAIA
jgi:hypothetical protein